MFIGLASARTDLFTGFMLKISVKKYLEVFLNFFFREMCLKLASSTVPVPCILKAMYLDVSQSVN